MAHEKHYEMQWDCQFCGTKKLLGKTHRFCPNCGAPQNPASRYYPADNEKIAVEDHKFVGVDVTCPACNQLNAGNAEFCQQCGSPLKGGVSAVILEAQSAAAGEAFVSSGSRDVMKEGFDADMEAAGVKKKNEPSPNRKWLIAAAVAGLAVCIFAGWFLTRTVDASVIVTGHEWTRTTAIEEYSRFVEGSWRDVVPFGDNVVRGTCVEKQRSSRQVADGETCRTVRNDRGDGTFSESQSCTTNYRSEPIYDDFCQYSGQRWQFSHDLVMQGGLADPPTWGDTDLNCAGSTRIGCERISSQVEVYDFLLKSTDNTYRCPVDAVLWRNTTLETAFTLKVSAIAKANAQCDTLKAVN